MPEAPITPVTVLTGFLGSGKTTLLNRIVSDPRFADSAILVNEWGEIPIDHALVRSASENVVTLPTGCICCRVTGDVVRALRELHFQRVEGKVGAFRRVVIETTGLADPAPLLRTLVEMPVVAARYALGGVVATVDAEYGMGTLDENAEAVKQAAMADRIVVTKVDRASDRALGILEARLRALNPGAALLRAIRGDLDPERLFDAGLHRSQGAPDSKGWLNAGAYRSFAAPAAGGSAHDARIRSFAWRWEAPWTWEDLEAALETLVDLQGARILRLKGLVNVANEPGPAAVHGVQHTIYPLTTLPDWPDEDRGTRLVFIGRDLEERAVAQILESFAPAARPSAAPGPFRFRR